MTAPDECAVDLLDQLSERYALRQTAFACLLSLNRQNIVLSVRYSFNGEIAVALAKALAHR